MNTIHMQARLGKDPETRDVGDTTVTRLWLAESEKYKKKDGEQVEHTNWIGAEVWGKRGEAVARFFNKGDGILIRGSLRVTEKDDQRYHSIRVDDWEFPMSRKSEDGGSPAAQASGVSDRYDNTDPKDDIPF